MKLPMLTILLAVPFVAMAQDDSGGGKKKPKKDPTIVFKTIDENEDGKLSVEEFIATKKPDAADRAKKVFSSKDKNSDGFLSLEEFTAKKP